MSGTATNRTNITLPSEVSSVILQKTQEQSAIMALAQRVSLPGHGLTIPVITSDPAAAWVSETENKPVANPGLSTKLMTGYTLAVIVPFSNQFRRDLPALYNALVGRLPLALAKKFDYTVANGSTPGSNFDVLSGCTAQNISSTTYASLVAAYSDIAENGGDLNGFAITPNAKAILLGALDSTNRPLFIDSPAVGAIPMLLGAPVHQSKGIYKAGVSADVVGIAGDWTQAVYGIVEGIDISISEEATLTTGTQEAPVTINLWQKNMFAVRAEIEIGFRADTNCFNLLTATASGATGATGES